MSFTIAELIERKLVLREYIEVATKEFEEKMKPYRDAEATIQTAILARLQADGLQNFKCGFGTAYQRLASKASVEDRDRYLSFVAQGNWDFVTNHVRHEAVDAYMAEHDLPPPGLKIESSISCVIRKS